ncbi:MAG: FG-GAP-like repeat-containing protein [Bacteroidetes bacterium]|nr:FG-GAP-like repeat-containing protein [Bacteroidota bacterium]
MRTLSIIFISFLWLLLPGVCVSQTPHILWHYDLAAPSFGQAAMADIDNDGKLEIVFSTYMGDGTVYALNAEDGSLLWKYYTGSCNDAAPIIYDVDGDGNKEVIVASSCLIYTYCFNGATGEVKWKSLTGGTDSPPAIGDLDNDGKPEILHGEFNGKVICFNGEDGSKKWEKVVEANTPIQTSPAILDVDGNGQLDFVVATWGGYYPNYYSNIFAFRGDTRVKIWESYTLSDDIYHGCSFGDIDSDGKPELVFGCYNDTVYALNAEDGSMKWKFDMGPYCYVGAPTVMADVNLDHKFEILASGWYEMKAISDTGTEVWNYDIPNYGSCFRGPAVSDINYDGALELVFGTSEGSVIALYGYDGSEIWQLDLAADYGNTFDINHAPVIGDFDGDGKLDGFVVGGVANYPDTLTGYGRAYAFTLGDGTGPDWTMFQHDTARSSCVPLDWYEGIPKHISSVEDLSVTTSPNPFIDNLKINISMKRPSSIKMDLLDLSGRYIATVAEMPNHKSDVTFNWDCSKLNLEQGIYLVKISAGKISKMIKVVKQGRSQ